MKNFAWKILVNAGCIFILMLSFSSITTAQGQQRPSQRSFATVLEKIKEKKSGRDRMIQQAQQPVYKSGTLGNPDAAQPPAPQTSGLNPSNRPVDPAAPVSGNPPDPKMLPSRQEIRLPAKPKGL
ncbi:MAG TPA: hypothetical protein VFX58_20500 [Chitinophagaceae bacterium]|nr:hypothetical protein [Chitinophagaceae bacterium]